MQIVNRYKFPIAAALAILVTAAIVAAKPPQPPPPPPPAATYEVEFLWDGSVTSMNQAGDMIGVENGAPRIYIADLDLVFDPNTFLSEADAARWHIDRIGGGISNSGGFTCHAVYLSDDGALIEGGRYPCRLNWITGTIEPYITAVPAGLPGTSFLLWSWGLTDDGTVCGTLSDTNQDVHYAFIVSPDNELSYPWGGPLDAPAWDSYAEGMNESGQIVGRVFPIPYYASGIFSYRYTADTDEMVVFNDRAQAQAINNHGDVAGKHQVTITTTKPPRTTTATRTFRYSDDPTAYTDDDDSGFKTFDVSGYPQGINDAGDILVDSSTSLGGEIYLEQKKLWVDFFASGVVMGTSADVAEWYKTTNSDGTTRYRDDNMLLNNAGTISGTMRTGSTTYRVFVLRRKT